jgi:formate hydrogenlyase transcriptional activator
MHELDSVASEARCGRSGVGTETLCRLAVDAFPHGVLLLRPDGAIAVVNRQVEQQFGYSRRELVGQSVDMLLTDEVRAGPSTELRAGPSTLLRAGPELCGRRRDGSRFPIEIELSPIETAHGTFVFALIGKRREAQAAKRLTLKGQLQFERLIAELSVQFINLPVDQVDGAIHAALRRIGEAMGLDRCTFYQIEPGDLLTAPLSWQRAGIPPVPTPTPASERFPWAFETVLAGGMVCFSSVEEIPNPVDQSSYRSFGTRSSVLAPISVGGRIVGAIGFNMVHTERSWLPEEVHRLRVFAGAFSGVLARRQGEEALHRMLAEVQRLRDRVHAENVYLRREAQERLGTAFPVGKSAAIRRVEEQVHQVAATDSTVLLLGETGTGKELFATKIHELSGRRARTMVRVNCSAIPATLMESELFGREKGAYTGALAQQIGRFELANHSTIFLDEIGDLPAEIQVKLLRVLEERQIERLGSPKALHVDVRIIAATHRNLEQRIADNAFREDLFYRFNVFPIQVPPLRDRVEDIPLLVWHLVAEFSTTLGKRIDEIPRENMAALQQYSWPGNIRELRNAVERAMILATGPRLTIAVPTSARANGLSSAKLTDVEKAHILGVLESTGWRIRGSGGAADRLGLRPTTLETRMAKLGLSRPKVS